MHFIFSPIGSAGDVHPMLGIAIALHKRGHEITFQTNGYFQETVERHGLRFIELGSKAQFLSVANHPDLWKPRRAFRYIFQKGVQPILRLQYAAIEEHSKSRDTVVVASCLGFGARIAQEKLGVPLVTIHLQPAVIPSRMKPPTNSGIVGPRWFKNLMFSLAGRLVIDRMICPEVNRFRQELGLPPVRQIVRWWHSPQLVVCLFPEWFAPPQSDWPGNLLQTDFPLWDKATSVALAPGVQEFLAGGEPPIIFTPGSANVFGRPFFQAAVVAAELGALIGSEAVERACRRTAERFLGKSGVAAAADAIEQVGS